MTEVTDTCTQCGHELDPHALITYDPLRGGIVLCPVLGCTCYSTLALGGVNSLIPDLKALPDRWEVEALRQRLQKGAS